METNTKPKHYGMYGVRTYLGKTIKKSYIPGGRLGIGYAFYRVDGIDDSFRKLKDARKAIEAAAPHKGGDDLINAVLEARGALHKAHAILHHENIEGAEELRRLISAVALFKAVQPPQS